MSLIIAFVTATFSNARFCSLTLYLYVSVASHASYNINSTLFMFATGDAYLLIQNWCLIYYWDIQLTFQEVQSLNFLPSTCKYAYEIRNVYFCNVNCR